MLFRVLSITCWAASLTTAATIYNDQATFHSNIAPGFYLQNFNFNPLMGGSVASQNYSGNGFSYTISASDGSDLYISLNGWLATYDSNRALVVNFTSGNIYAVGANFFHTNLFDNILWNTALTIELSDGTIETIASTTGTDYRGFVASVPITSMRVWAPGVMIFSSMDNLTVGGLPLGTGSAGPANADPVPEPGTWTLMAAGAALLIAGRVRRA